MENQTELVGRNEPCPCGSKKKFKRCCGKEAPPFLTPPQNPSPEFNPPPGMNLKPGMMDQLKKGMNLKLMMKLSKIIKKLPPDQIQELQGLMSQAMAGKDVSREMESLSKSFPKEFQDLISSMQGKVQKNPEGSNSDGDSETIPKKSLFSKVWKSFSGKKE